MKLNGDTDKNEVERGTGKNGEQKLNGVERERGTGTLSRTGNGEERGTGKRGTGTLSIGS